MVDIATDGKEVDHFDTVATDLPGEIAEDGMEGADLHGLGEGGGREEKGGEKRAQELHGDGSGADGQAGKEETAHHRSVCNKIAFAARAFCNFVAFFFFVGLADRMRIPP
jgi:hypothetical protein